jgi:hypothetical protein
MPDPNTNDASPDLSSVYGYRPPKFFNDTLQLDPQLAALAPGYPYALGWYLQPRLSYTPLSLGLQNSDLDNALAPYMASLSSLTTAQPNQAFSTVLPQAMAGASTDSDLMDAIRDAVSDAAQDKFWQKIPGQGKNVVTGEQATIGSIDPSGTPHYDPLDQIVPGTQLKSTWLTQPWALGKRFPFASGNDVYFKLYVDKDAIGANKPADLISGGSITIEGKSSDGLSRSLTIVGGRSQAGGPAGAVLFEMRFK